MASRCLVLSIGNPKPYLNTLHSAGHFVLAQTQQALGVQQQPNFQPQKFGGQRCLTSFGDPYTMAQSPTLMNVTGPWLAKAYKDFLSSNMLQASEAPLVVIHDELEEALGNVRTRPWSASARGHNGIKSCHDKLQAKQFQDPHWYRIAIGIGRPQSRDADAVSDYVLSNMTSQQMNALKKQAVPKVLRALDDIRSNI
ncbi:peptidyl-tRNA hydrolase [Xylariomycetidae sp. FL0641]|nr:peptidyl-tRNA hydrolase [Xylariomycetidae sp. FL0641]